MKYRTVNLLAVTLVAVLLAILNWLGAHILFQAWLVGMYMGWAVIRGSK